VPNITWRALPAEFGPWNRLWKRFWRLSQNGTFEALFQSVADCSLTAGIVQMFDSTSIRAHVSAAGAKGGQQNEALGRSRGGFGTKLHVKCDLEGHPLEFHLTANGASDSRQSETLLDIGPDVTPRGVITDKDNDAATNRAVARSRGIAPVIPYRSNIKDGPKFFPKRPYRLRARVELFIGKLKRFKPVAMRCEKTKQNYAAFIALACAFILVKSVHIA
jgi:transposase